MTQSTNTYAEDGVDVHLGDELSSFAAKIAAGTFGNSPLVQVNQFKQDRFRGPRGFKLKLPEGVKVFHTHEMDGIGTKTVLHDAAGTHGAAAHDLVAMVFDDIARYGGLPLVCSNILDVSSLKSAPAAEAVKSFLRALGSIMNRQRTVLLTGEIAELGPCVRGENPTPTLAFNAGAIAEGIYQEDAVITGTSIRPGNIVMALYEPGFGSNGISSVRAAFGKEYGSTWYAKNKRRGESQEDFLRRKSDIKLAAAPSVVYSRLITHLHGWRDGIPRRPIIPLRGIAHITGGGIVGKFGGDLLFPNNFSAELTNLYDPPEIVSKVKAMRGIGDDEVFSSFSCGQRMLVVIDKEDYVAFRNVARTEGIKTTLCGVITRSKETPRLIITSQFPHNRGEQIVFKP